MAINFVKNDDIRILRDIEQYYATQIDEMPMNGKFFCFIYVENIGFLNIYSYIHPDTNGGKIWMELSNGFTSS